MFFILLPLLCAAPAWADLKTEWAYTTVAKTIEGHPCLTNCISGQCIVDWDGHKKACVSTNKPAPLYYTAQVNDKTHEHCLTNCGSFGWHYEWCVTEPRQGGWKWDYCNSAVEPMDLEEASAVVSYRSIYKTKCTEPQCVKLDNTNYYRCFVDKDSWEFCAPPAKSRMWNRLVYTLTGKDEKANSI